MSTRSLAVIPPMETATVARAEAPQRIGGMLPVQRLNNALPLRVTGLEKRIAREFTARQTAVLGYEQLHSDAAVAIGRMHDVTHLALVAGVCSLNARVRDVQHPDDRAELERITARQKFLYQDHQLGLLEGSARSIADLAVREMYKERAVESRKGLAALLSGE